MECGQERLATFVSKTYSVWKSISGCTKFQTGSLPRNYRLLQKNCKGADMSKELPAWWSFGFWSADMKLNIEINLRLVVFPSSSISGETVSHLSLDQCGYRALELLGTRRNGGFDAKEDLIVAFQKYDEPSCRLWPYWVGSSADGSDGVSLDSWLTALVWSAKVRSWRFCWLYRAIMQMNSQGETAFKDSRGPLHALASQCFEGLPTFDMGNIGSAVFHL